jgi:hypothetical protein
VDRGDHDNVTLGGQHGALARRVGAQIPQRSAPKVLHARHGRVVAHRGHNKLDGAGGNRVSAIDTCV